MFQFMPQFLEVIFLIATAYLYWSMRKLAKKSSSATFVNSNETADRKTKEELSEMANNLTELLTELQAANNAVHHDLSAQSDNLQQLLAQSEAAATKLRSLIEGAEDISYSDEVHYQNKHTKVNGADKTEMTKVFPRTLAQALNLFKYDLNNSGCSDYTVTWVTVYTRRFLIWWHGDDWHKLPHSRIESTKTDSYLNYLKKQNYQADIVERTKIALSYFSDWTDDCIEMPASKPEPGLEPHSVNLPTQLTSQTSILLGTNRYQNVLSLAEQGLDRPTIAAKTGLEQEAIRLLLTMESSSLISH
ncbi:MAG: hypothetical protein KDJ65_03875 [Anaerolineae bacterium]|nr:hypothetical protein [Anaerolineae bacterium]